jgi:hypothetical protein
MKKLLFVAAFAAIGLASAYANASRASIIYVQTAADQYNPLTLPYDPAKCLGPTTKECAFAVPTNFGTNKTRAQVVAAGGVVQTAAAKIYIP